MHTENHYFASLGAGVGVLVGMLIFGTQVQATAHTTPNPLPAAPAPHVALHTNTHSNTEITLTVGGHTYSERAASSESVSTLMQSLAATTDFRFTAKEYPSLGLFIESINGTPNAHGKYWMFYINGIQSQLGVSSAPVHPGDVVEWKLE